MENRIIKTIEIKPGSFGEKILENLKNRRIELDKKMEERMKTIRKFGWDAYWKDRVENHGAKFIKGTK